jgi:hypothetical protein
MKRRSFGLMSAASAAAVSAGIGLPQKARAALTTADADRLKSELTPVGAERAGNADGSIPAWTGENLPLEGSGPWGILPDFFASDAKIVSINAANADQYKDRLTPGTVAMMQKYPDFRIDVYPTHRPAIATQEVYDNAYKNVTGAQPAPGGSRFGVTNAYGAIPFPIPDPNDASEAGAQIIQNHSFRWFGPYQTRNLSIYTMVNGQLVLATGDRVNQSCPYYFPGGDAASFDSGPHKGQLRNFLGPVFAPPQSKGQSYLELNTTNQLENPVKIWEYLVGQGRVRRAPELQYDTPETQANDLINYDESYGWYGSQDRYDWKCLGKKEMYIPYNNNKLCNATPQEAHGKNFINPDLVRWELHRVWVVDATLHAGARNVLPHRVFYVDEDTWTIAATDSFDAQGNQLRVVHVFNENRPDIPAVSMGTPAFYNFQSGDYVTVQAPWNTPPYDQPYLLTPIPDSTFNPQAMAAAGEY